jgi:hypothetical protein
MRSKWDEADQSQDENHDDVNHDGRGGCQERLQQHENDQPYEQHAGLE